MHVRSLREWPGRPEQREFVPDAAAGAVVFLVGVWRALTGPRIIDGGSSHSVSVFVVIVAMAVAVGLCRRAPAVALGIIVGVGLLHMVTNTPLLQIELAGAVVIFGTARWGRPATAVAGLVAAVAAGIIGPGYLGWRVVRLVDEFLPSRLVDVALDTGTSLDMVIGAAALGALVAAWLAGLTLRFMASATTSRESMVRAEEEAERAHHESAQAYEIARLRDEQVRLARDVHDVVGHSLAVILAQAESAQFVADADAGKLKETMRTIAETARGSLNDVREVLSPTRDAPAGPRPLDDLIEGVRAGGHRVELAEVGRPQPLPPELEVVAYRVLQEMLTNAIKHGRRDQPIRVERNWPTGPADTLRITVANAADLAETQPIALAGAPRQGQGIDGMRRRLDSVGGHLDVRLESGEAATAVFTSTAWVPVRSVVR